MLFGSLPPQPTREEEVINASKSNFIRVHLSRKEWRVAVVSARCGMGVRGPLMSSLLQPLMYTCDSLAVLHTHWWLKAISSASNKTTKLFQTERTLELDWCAYGQHGLGSICMWVVAEHLISTLSQQFHLANANGQEVDCSHSKLSSSVQKWSERTQNENCS